MAIILKSGKPAAIRQQLESLWQNQGGRQDDSRQTIRERLNTDAWTTAKPRFHDFLKKQKENSQRIIAHISR